METSWGPALGLTESDALVYARVLQEPGGTAADLAGQCALGEQDVGAIVGSLIERGFLRQAVEAPGCLEAVSPQIALRPHLGRAQSVLRERLDRLDSLEPMLESLTALHDEHNRRRRRRLVSEIFGAQAFQDHVTERQLSTQQELLVTVPSRHVGSALLRAWSATGEVALRGVRTRALILDSAGVTVRHLRRAARGWNRGIEVRFLPALPVCMVVTDRREATVAHDHLDLDEGAVAVSAPGVVQGLVELFEDLWRRAEVLHTTEPPVFEGARPHLTRSEGAIVSLLAQGAKDQAIANQLGVSVRTVRRAIAAVCERVGASSRFELGAAAVRHGWCVSNS